MSDLNTFVRLAQAAAAVAVQDPRAAAARQQFVNETRRIAAGRSAT